jgi:hypothetical protein
MSASCRLLRSLVLDSSNNGVRVTMDPGGSPVSGTRLLTAGTYYASADGTSSDLFDELKTQLDTIDSTFTVAVNGSPTVLDSTKPEGFIRITHDALDFQFEFGHVQSTIDPRVLGFEASAGTYASMAQTLWAPYESLIAWYPQFPAADQRKPKAKQRAVTFSSNRTPKDTDWDDYSEYFFRFERVQPPFASEEAGQVAAIATANLLAQNDPNAAYEVFALALSPETEHLLFTPDITVPATSWGPFLPKPGSNFYTKPLGLPSVKIEGRQWMLQLDGWDTPS